MKLIDHPEKWKTGTRVLILKGRHKDGLETERRFARVTHNPESFDRAVAQFVQLHIPGERIYATAGPRDLRRASRVFKERQLEADYDSHPVAFYEQLEDRWVSCLMNSRSQAKPGKVWLFDCDEDVDVEHVWWDLKQIGYAMETYEYHSKSGVHIIVRPLNKSLLSHDSLAILHDNPQMLWGF